MRKAMLDRAAIAKLAQGVPQTIVALEKMFGAVDGVLPSTIEEANALAGQALAVAQAAVVSLSMFAEALERLEAAPVPAPQVEADDTAPRAHMGTISSQNADQVEITGGTAALSTLELSGQLTSTLNVGPPLVIASTDRVENLNVDRAGLADEATKLASPTTFPPAATDAASTQTLVNALRAAALAKGL